jgi:hypothetical protein
MEAIVRIVPYLLYHYPEYSAVCCEGNLIEMTSMHLPLVVDCMERSITKEDQQTFHQYFTHGVLVLRTLCYECVLRWETPARVSIPTYLFVCSFSICYV